VKINWKKMSIAGIATVVVLVAAAFAFSQRPDGPPQGPPMGPAGGFRGPGGPDGPRGPRGPFGPLGRDLNLTDDQKAQIKKIQDGFAESDKALFEALRTLHQNEGDPMSGAFDEGTVRAAAEARAKIQIELEVSHAKMMSQIASVLTADQKAQLAARRAQFQRQGPPPPQQP
jgi:Spy/CpxP family protein refolding chaperone